MQNLGDFYGILHFLPHNRSLTFLKLIKRLVEVKVHLGFIKFWQEAYS